MHVEGHIDVYTFYTIIRVIQGWNEHTYLDEHHSAAVFNVEGYSLDRDRYLTSRAIFKANI